MGGVSKQDSGVGHDELSLIDARSHQEWLKCLEEYKTRSIPTARVIAGSALNLDVEAIDGLVYLAKDAAPAGDTHTILDEAVRLCSRVPGGFTALLAYLYCRCVERWEQSSQHDSLLSIIDAVLSLAAGSRRSLGVSDSDRKTAQVFLALLDALKCGFKAENALNCSSPSAMLKHSGESVEHARGASESIRVLESDSGQDSACMSLAQLIAETQIEYFSALSLTSRTLVDYHTFPYRSLRDELSLAIDELLAIEQSEALRYDAYSSDVRAHRLTLQKLLDLDERPCLSVGEGQVSYCYPFGLRGASARILIHDSTTWRPGRIIGRAAVLFVEDLHLTDIWEASDPEGRGYRGVSIKFQDLQVTSIDGVELPPHTVEVRLSDLGVCYLRVRTRVSNAMPPLLNQFVRRGSTQMGHEEIRSGDAEYRSITEFAQELIQEIQRMAVAASAIEGGESSRTEWSPHRISTGSHTVLSVHKWSLVDRTGEARDIASIDEAKDAVGESILAPRLIHTAATLDEYLRYPPGHPLVVIDDLTFDGDVVLRSNGMTVILMATTPTFLTMSYEEMTEFSAAVPALLEEWNTLLYRQADSLRTRLRETRRSADADGREGAAIASRTLRALEAQRISLQAEVADARSLLSFLRSHTLCRTPRYRAVLDSLLDASGLSSFEKDLEGRFLQVNSLYTIVYDLSKEEEARREQWYQLALEVLLVLLGVLSLSEFAGLFNELFPENLRPVLIVIELAIMLAVGIGFSLARVRIYRRQR